MIELINTFVWVDITWAQAYYVGSTWSTYDSLKNIQSTMHVKNVNIFAIRSLNHEAMATSTHQYICSLNKLSMFLIQNLKNESSYRKM
jgi:hypothetical protein